MNRKWAEITAHARKSNILDAMVLKRQRQMETCGTPSWRLNQFIVSADCGAGKTIIKRGLLLDQPALISHCFDGGKTFNKVIIISRNISGCDSIVEELQNVESFRMFFPLATKERAQKITSLVTRVTGKLVDFTCNDSKKIAQQIRRLFQFQFFVMCPETWVMCKDVLTKFFVKFAIFDEADSYCHPGFDPKVEKYDITKGSYQQMTDMYTLGATYFVSATMTRSDGASIPHLLGLCEPLDINGKQVKALMDERFTTSDINWLSQNSTKRPFGFCCAASPKDLLDQMCMKPNYEVHALCGDEWIRQLGKSGFAVTHENDSRRAATIASQGIRLNSNIGKRCFELTRASLNNNPLPEKLTLAGLVILPRELRNKSNIASDVKDANDEDMNVVYMNGSFGHEDIQKFNASTMSPMFTSNILGDKLKLVRAVTIPLLYTITFCVDIKSESEFMQRLGRVRRHIWGVVRKMNLSKTEAIALLRKKVTIIICNSHWHNVRHLRNFFHHLGVDIDTLATFHKIQRPHMYEEKNEELAADHIEVKADDDRSIGVYRPLDQYSKAAMSGLGNILAPEFIPIQIRVPEILCQRRRTRKFEKLSIMEEAFVYDLFWAQGKQMIKWSPSDGYGDNVETSEISILFDGWVKAAYNKGYKLPKNQQKSMMFSPCQFLEYRTETGFAPLSHIFSANNEEEICAPKFVLTAPTNWMPKPDYSRPFVLLMKTLEANLILPHGLFNYFFVVKYIVDHGENYNTSEKAISFVDLLEGAENQSQIDVVEKLQSYLHITEDIAILRDPEEDRSIIMITDDKLGVTLDFSWTQAYVCYDPSDTSTLSIGGEHTSQTVTTFKQSKRKRKIMATATVSRETMARRMKLSDDAVHHAVVTSKQKSMDMFVARSDVTPRTKMMECAPLMLVYVSEIMNGVDSNGVSVFQMAKLLNGNKITNRNFWHDGEETQSKYDIYSLYNQFSNQFGDRVSWHGIDLVQPELLMLHKFFFDIFMNDDAFNENFRMIRRGPGPKGTIIEERNHSKDRQEILVDFEGYLITKNLQKESAKTYARAIEILVTKRNFELEFLETKDAYSEIIIAPWNKSGNSKFSSAVKLFIEFRNL